MDDDNEEVCLECGKPFQQERDLQICDDCIPKFDTDKLWSMHDKKEIDALDFNESKDMREKFRLTPCDHDWKLEEGNEDFHVRGCGETLEKDLVCSKCGKTAREVWIFSCIVEN